MCGSASIGNVRQPLQLQCRLCQLGAPFTTLTSNPTNYEVNSHGYGSSYTYLGGNFNGSNYANVQFDVTVNTAPTTGVGVVLDLNDSSNNGEAYAWYGLVPGGGNVSGNPNEYILTMPLSAGTYFDGTGVLNTSSISQMNLGIDPGSSAATYDVQFNDLSLTAVPEPTALRLPPLVGCFRFVVDEAADL